MTDSIQTTKNLQKPIKGRSLWIDAIGRLRKRKLAMICFGIILFYVFIACYVQVAEWTGSSWPTNWDESTGQKYESPNAQNIFGTDIFGYSILRKVLYGTKISLQVAFFASILSILIGVPMGAAAGYFGGFIDDVIVWIYSTLSSIPYILLILAFALVLKDKTPFGFKLAGATTVYLAIGLTSWVGICRLIRGEILKRKESEYVLAARAMGCSGGRIIFKHLLPNTFHIVIITFSLRFMSFIHAEVILSFLGLGEKDKPSWGAMIDSARLDLPKGYWWEMTAATLAILIISLALNIFGDALRDCLDPKLRTD
ncbi:MAG: ABC transporter permease [Phycisphaerae bacterium]|nr:ABC transporter permease [Phycisphaerae bacterium]